MERTCIVVFFNDTATTEIYTLSLHDALPISLDDQKTGGRSGRGHGTAMVPARTIQISARPSGRRTMPSAMDCPLGRSEEHTAELQSRQYIVCRSLPAKKIDHRLFRVHSHSRI